MIYMCGHGEGHGFCHYPGRGIIQLLILRVLHEKPSHGYQIMNELKRITSENYVPEPGAVYTMLRRMEEIGFVASKWERERSKTDRRVYTLTDYGLRVLKEGLEMLKKRKQLMDGLIKFYDANFGETKKGGGK